MRICLLLPESRPSGGLFVALGHARRLQASGEFRVDVVVLSGRPESNAEEQAATLSLEQAARESYDVAIATWWETVPALLRLRAEHRVVLVQSAEERFYRGEEESLERLGAALALAAPVHFFAVADWLTKLVCGLRPDASCWHVPNGIDKSRFVPAPTPAAAAPGPLRVLVEGQHNLWFKGVDDALEAVSRMREPHEATLVSLDPAGAPDVPGLRVVGGLDRDGMRAEYARHDVLLKFSRVESLGLPLVEACHTGLPCVVTPFTGHEEVIHHGENGLVVGFDDPDAAARTLDRLATDRAALHAMSEAAVASMRDWPSEDEATAQFALALRELRDAPPPAPGAAPFERWRAAAEVARVGLGEMRLRDRELAGSVAWLEDALEGARAEVERLTTEQRELVADHHASVERLAPERQAARIAALEHELSSIQESRSYQAARRAQNVLHRLRR